MEIIDLAPEHEGLYFLCLEDWSDEAKESGPRKGQWYAKMKGKGLRVKLAKDDDGQIAGMVQYLPVEHSFIEGQGLYFIHCLWVHGHKQGRGDRRGRGIGKALLAAAEADARALGAKGIAAWGISLPFWMRASWYKKQGYRRADNNAGSVLMWKPFAPDATPPRWIKERKRPSPVDGKVAVTSFVNGWCLGQNLTYERAKRAAATFGDSVAFQEFDTSDRATLLEWGISDGLFIDGRPVRTGPPPSYKKVRGLIGKRVRRLRR